MSGRDGTDIEAAGKGASLISARAMGGLHAAAGFSVQTRFIAIRLAGWLSNPKFKRLQPERLEDVDAFFGEGADEAILHHQIKNETLTPGLVREIVENFRSYQRSRSQHLVLASPRPGDSVLHLFQAIERARNAAVAEGDADGARAATETELTKKFEDAKLGDLQTFILENVDFDFDFVSATSTDDAAISRLVGDLSRLPRYAGYPGPDLRVACCQLLQSLNDSGTRSWTAEQIHALLESTIAQYRQGPVAPAGDLLLICHQSFAPVSQFVERIALSPDVSRRRPIPLLLDGIARMASGSREDIQRVCDELSSSSGLLRQALSDRPHDPVVYYGFPHVPLGVLAGAIIGPQRAIHVLEHDRETEQFAWHGGDLPRIAPPEIRRGSGKVAVLRLSVSAKVLPEISKPKGGRIGLELGVAVEQVGRGIITTEEAAREIVRIVRVLLDEHVAGKGFASLHVFAAIPVSVAVLLGRALAASALPSTYVYNYNQRKKPPYHWRLCIQDALEGLPSVEILESGEGA
jgi:hypothetical protein